MIQNLRIDYLKTSETTSENLYNNAKKISDHQVKFLKYESSSDFGYYLAGLIEGIGHFSEKNKQVIALNIKDKRQAYLIKKKIGYGTVSKIKNKKAIKFVISSKKGIMEVLKLINGKIRTESKYKQQKKFIEKFDYKITQLPIDISFFLSNPWQAGFIDADGSFQIKIIKRINRKKPEIRQAQQIDQKTKPIQEQLKKELGGFIGYRVKQDIYYYSSVNFRVAKKYIEYLNKYKIMSYKYINYIKWRKVYIMISKKEHLTANMAGINKIKNYKR